jgi:SNF2 family DNA or RNA helicase
MTTRTWYMGLLEDGIYIDLNGYDPALNKELKAALPGPARWNKSAKWWEFPLHWDTCVNTRKMAEKYDAKIVINPPLKEWAFNEKARQDAIPDVQSMDLVDLENVRSNYPAIWDAISSRPFQTVGAAFAARNRSCLIADQPGLGKTIQSIAAIIESGCTGPILVVAPKAAAKLTWPEELARWVPGDEVQVLGAHLTPTERKQLVGSMPLHSNCECHPGKRLWLITSPNYVRIKAETDDYGKYKKVNGQKVIKPVGEAVMGIFDVTWSAVIVDESHQTLAGASGDKKKQSAQRVGLGALDVRDDGLRIALSGTPFRGKEEYLWGQLNFLRPDLYRSRWRWINQFFDVQQGRFGMLIGGMVNKAAMYEDASKVMIRRTKAEVAKDLPPKMYGGYPLDSAFPDENIAVWLDMDPKQAKAYQQITTKAEAELEGGTLMTMGVLSELTRLKQFAGSYGMMTQEGHFKPTLPSNKFDWLVEFLDERGIAKELDNDSPKIVVASQFSQLIDCFAQELGKLGIKTHKFTGSTSDANRERIKDDWQNNSGSDTRVLLLTTTAGGVSLTLDAASELVILDETWDPSSQEQLEDRLHRLSRMHQVTIWKVFSRGTVEEGIARNNLKSEMSIKSIIDGERGVDFSKLVLGKAA